jgi:tetratricopeptide (TPR) repeat protein
MGHKRSVSAYGAGFKRKQIIKKTLLAALILVILCLLPLFFLKLRGRGGNERNELRGFFESGMFETAYTQSKELLNEKPLDYFLLTINGFSAYELAVAQINSFDTLSYIDNCIWSLRKALLSREGSSDGRLFYVLGKAYYYKGSGYADLAVKYLEKARSVEYWAPDIPEYLGIAYAAVRDYRSSVAAFTLALSEANPSDILLLSIARSYIALEEYEPARAYLVRCQEVSKDSKNIAAARLLLGNILIKTGDIPGAEAEFLKALEENSENAEAHFQLGEIYAMGGDTTRARAEWRRAVRIDPAHGPARGRLNIQ